MIVVFGGNWPSAASADDLTMDEVLAVLDEMDDYWSAALDNLGSPPENRSDGA